MVVGGVLVARARRKLLQRKAAARVVPVMGRGFGGVSVEGRF